MILCKLNTDCEKNFYCDKVLSLCVSCWDICDPKKALKHECSQECSRFMEELHQTKQPSTEENVMTPAPNTASAKTESLLTFFLIFILCIFMFVACCTAGRIIVFIKPNSKCGKTLNKLANKIKHQVCTTCFFFKGFQGLFIPEYYMLTTSSRPGPESESEHESRRIKKSPMLSSSQSASLDSDSGIGSENATSQEVANLHTESETQPLGSNKLEEEYSRRKTPSQSHANLNNMPNPEFQMGQSNDLTQAGSKIHQVLDDQSGLPSRNNVDYYGTSNSCANFVNTNIPIRNNSTTRGDTWVLVDNSGTQGNTLPDKEETRFDIDIRFSTTPKVVVPSMDFEPCCHLETMEENQLDEEFKKVPAAQNATAQPSSKKTIHPNKRIYDIMKNIDWIQGYYSEGSSIEVFVDMNHISQEVAMKELTVRTGCPPDKFHITHESG